MLFNQSFYYIINSDQRRMLCLILLIIKKGIQILKEQKQVLDLRFCNILDDNNAAPKYYFADSNGNRISN